MLATNLSSFDDNSTPFSVDTDGISFIIDNSATGAICNTKSMFIGPFVDHTVNLVTAEGQSTTTKRVGTIRLILRDDGGTDWSYDIPNVIYDPDSPYSLLGIPFLGEYFASNTDDSYDEETWIRSASTSSHFVWDHGKHERHFAHGPSNLPELLTNEGNSYFSAFCTRLSTFFTDKVHYAFSSAYTISPDGVHQPPAIISQEVEEDEFPEVQWYTPPNISNSVEPLPKRVRFDDSTKPAASLSDNNDVQDFQIGSEVIYTSNGTAQNVVYEGVDRNGVNHYIRHKDGSRSFVSRSTLTLLDQISFSNIPKTPLDYCQEVGKGIAPEVAHKLAYPRALTPQQQELMSWHHRLYHLPFNRIFMLAKRGWLPKVLLKLQDKLPLCAACQFGAAHRRPWRFKGKKSGSIRRSDQTKPGDGVSVDQIISAQPGLIPQMAGALTSRRIWGCTNFVDHVSDFVYVHLMQDLTLDETLLSKVAFEKICDRAGRTVKHYQADNGRFADKAFLDDCNSKNQTITFCGVGAHHQNGIVENKNKQLTQGARTLLLHGMRMWPQMIDQMFWPFAVKAMAERMNSITIDTNGETPESKFYGVPLESIPVKTFHTMFCPCYVLDGRLQAAGSIGPPKWEPRSNIRVYLGHSPFHAGSVALVYNPSTGHVSPQFHVVFDDDFTTVPYMEAGNIPPNWEDLVTHSSEKSTPQALALTQAWLGKKDYDLSINRDYTDLQLTDDPLLDPYAIVTGIPPKSTLLSYQLPSNSKKQLQRLALPVQNTAASEGEDLTTPSNAPVFRPGNGKEANAERASVQPNISRQIQLGNAIQGSQAHNISDPDRDSNVMSLRIF
jgi:hypothetical protein